MLGGASTHLLDDLVGLGADGGVEDLGICSHQVDQQAQVPLFLAGESQRAHVASPESLRLDDPEAQVGGHSQVT